MIRIFLLAVLSLLPIVPVSAQEWPTKPVRFIVGYPAGGGHDFVARTVAQRMSGTVEADLRGGEPLRRIRRNRH